MDMTLGKRIAYFRKEKSLTQEGLAQLMNVSAQAVSKWENDQTCPDISLLPQLAKILGVTVDELLCGKQEQQTAVQMLPQEEQKSIADMMLRITMDSAEGDKVRVNLPLALIQIALDCGMEVPQVTANEAMKQIDWRQVMTLVSHGVIGDLVEVEDAEGTVVRVFVE